MDSMRQQGWKNDKQFKGIDSDEEWNTRQEDRGQVMEGFFVSLKCELCSEDDEEY